MTTTFRDTARISGGETASRELAFEAMAGGQILRSGARSIALPVASEDFAIDTLPDLARNCLDLCGVPTRGLSKADLVHKALAHSSDVARGKIDGLRSQTYAGVLENTFNKVMMASFFAVSQSWRRWCSVSQVKSFNRATRVGFSGSPVLEETHNGNIETIILGDRTEYQTVATRAGILKIPRQALVNDDLSAFTAAAKHLGESADATINAAVYDSLTTASGVGPLLSDGTALFATSRGNYVATSGGAPSVTTLNAARKAMRTRTDPQSGRALNVAAKYLIVPPSLESTARVLVAADRIADHPENLEVVVEAALEGGTNGTTAWYLAADQALVPTFDVAGLLGDPLPILDQKFVFETDTLEFRALVDFGVAPLDSRGLYRDIGA